jgi:subtilisin-like proprotein convertase family protein
MPKSRVNPPFFILLLLIFCFNLLPIPAQARNYLPTTPNQPAPAPAELPTAQTTLPAGLNFAPGYNKVTIDAADKAALTAAARNGGYELADYGSFSLWKIPTTPSLNAITRTNAVQAHPEFDQIELRSGKVSTTRPNAREARTGGPQLWLVQFVGPIKTEWLETLKKAGITPVIYTPNNAYVVWADGSQLDQLNSLVATGNSVVQWAGNYKPEYRLAPSLQNLKSALAGQPLTITVQFYTTPSVQTSLKRLTALGGKVIEASSQVLNFTDITLEMPSSVVTGLSAWPDVFNIEPWVAPHLRDEAQGQIIAGNITTTLTGAVVPTSPGYLSWLSANGFSSNPADYPLVDVTDDGIDNGTSQPLHPDFYELGSKTNPARLIYNQNCTADPLADGQAGHGNLNAGIVGGYNNTAGSPYEDAKGYQYGLGISPFGRLGGTKIFNNTGVYDLSGCGNSLKGVVAASYNAGARITSNSWGSSVAGAYTADSQAYDAFTRDASTTLAGNQQMLHIFAAGNDGSGSTTVGSPGTAKNVLTVGATENVRDDGVQDGCGYIGANNADDMATFSSRGPTSDNRTKPDLVAPGTHVQGPASQDPTYDGSGVCGGQNNFNGDPKARYYPNFAQNGITQTLYTWSSGTSHSTPALAGAASLVYNYYGRVLDPGQTPTPAMLKGLLINGTRYLNGSETGDTLPSNNQGWGGVDLKNIFDSSNHYCQLINQSVVLTGTGQAYATTCQIADPSKPVRVTLVWTDAPGTTTGSSYVNNLDLQVSFNGQTYKGNVFKGAYSTTGGSFDTRNNVENVFLPPGTTGLMGVKVLAANLAADAINGGPDPQQDFALIISNADPGPVGGSAILDVAGTTLSDLPPGGNANGVLEPGETLKLTAQLVNNGNGSAGGVTANLTSVSPYVTIITGTASYPTVPANGAAGPDNPFSFSVSSALPCGQPVTFTLQINYGASALTSVLSYIAGLPTLDASTAYTSADVPKNIPDNNPVGITSTLPIAASGTVGKVVVSVNVSHPYDGDVTLQLISPQGTPVTLVARRGGWGDNFTGTIFDDDAPTPISQGLAPFTGSYRPETPLSAVNDQPISGTWTLLATDSGPADTGALNGWSLTISPRSYACSAPTPQPAASLQVNGYPSPVPLGSSNPFTVTAKDSNGNLAANYTGTITFATDAASASLPPNYTFQPGDYGQHVFSASFNVTGAFSITATDTVTPSISGSQSGIAVQGLPAVISATGGTGQSAELNQPFTSHLTALVTDSGNNPLSGIVVTFTAPASGAGAVFFNSRNPITATTNSSGIADSGPVYANGVAGSYSVAATVAGVGIPASYSLTNTNTCNTFVVTSTTDNGQGTTCGTLSKAITGANTLYKLNSVSLVVITFDLPGGSATIAVTGQLPPVQTGVRLDGGDCTNGPAITIDGSGNSGNGITLAGGNLYNLRVANFGGEQIVAGRGGGELRCVRAVKKYP